MIKSVLTRCFATTALLLLAVGACGKSKVDQEPDVRLAPLAAPNGELRWIGSEGGGAGWLPVGEDDEERSRSFYAVGDVRGVKSVLSQHKRAALSLDADVLCKVAPTAEGARERLSINLFVGKPITAEVAECLHAIRAPAFSFAAERGPLSPAMLAILTRLDGCEALGVDYAGDEVARLLGDRADTPDGAALRSITLSGSTLGPEAIASLARRKKLRAVGLRGMSSPGAARGAAATTGLGALATLLQLERLDLSYGPVTDEDLTAFSSARALRWLMLESTSVGDAGIARFGGSPALEYANLDFTKVGDAGVEALAGLPRLQTLSLVRTGVTDRAAHAIARMKGLRHVGLALTKVTDAGIEEIVSLPELRTLSVPKEISAASVERWKRAHRHLRIDHAN